MYLQHLCSAKSNGNNPALDLTAPPPHNAAAGAQPKKRSRQTSAGQASGAARARCLGGDSDEDKHGDFDMQVGSMIVHDASVRVIKPALCVVAFY